ncbi:asparaginase [Herbiconiux daphne]|uniref:Asparaginase n=1 Tax=Herbiconiux daphne TaxID=2970914 RepID=A0ABT2H0Z2_9MICO|nr:asparaginase [Herbiconiux daphne]MCS5733598.1 asparaginase [Herbiconiux daphne]
MTPEDEKTPEGGTAGVDQSVELAVVDRSGFIESRHAGSAVVLDAAGEVAMRYGSPDLPVYPRSCMKPFQALTVLESGVELDPVQTVLATASHAATPAHIEVVLSILGRAGLSPDALGCPPDWPGDSRARDEVIREHGHRERLFMNCSGKHAAMLLACVENGWDTATYLDPSHPLQQRILATVERETGAPVVHSGIDGCGAPVHAMSLVSLARGIGRLRRAESGAAKWLTDSILANGWAIDGPGRANTVVIDRLGVVAKLGAEGVMVMATPDGSSIALKMLDGSLRAATLVALTLLARHGALTAAQVDDLRPTLDLTVTGGAAPVGTIRVSPTL